MDIDNLAVRFVCALENIAAALRGGPSSDAPAPTDEDLTPEEKKEAAKKNRAAAAKKKRDDAAAAKKAADDKKGPDKEAVRAALGKVQEEVDSEAAKAILEDCGVKTIGKLDESAYQDVIDACEEALKDAD